MSDCTTTGPYTYDPNVVVLWLNTVADVQLPTGSEVVSGISLQPAYNLTDIIGWEVETEVVSDGIWGPFDEQRMTRQSVPSAELVFSAGRDGVVGDIRSLLTRGQVGYIMILPSGPYAAHPTAPVHVYPVRVAQITPYHRLRTGQGALVTVKFAIRARCGENVTVTP